MSSPETPPDLVAVTGSLPLGGSSTFLLNLAKSRKAKGSVLPIVSLTDRNEMEDEFNRFGLCVESVRPRRLIYEDRLLEAYRLVAKWRPRAVLSCLSAESFEVLRSVPRGTLRLGIIQSDDPGPYAMVRHYAQALDAIVGVSSEICEKLRADLAFQGIKIAHIPYGITFPAAKPRQALPESNPTILKVCYVGRLVEEQKRISRIVALVHELGRAKIPVEFTISGAGPEAENLRRELSQYAFVRWTGTLSNQEVLALLETQDVFILLSDYEGLPLTLLEAMGAGAVPVISDLPSGISGLVTPKTGIRIPIGDIRSGVDAVRKLAADRSLLMRLSQDAQQHVRERYSASVMETRFLDLINGMGGVAPTTWPQTIRIPAPYLVSPQWMFSGLPRIVRRTLRQVSRGF